jgi:hypothetical protein
VTTGTGGGAAAADAGDFASQWRELRGDGDIQFAPVEVPPPPEPPQWWQDFLEWLGDLLRPIADFLGSIGKLIGVSGQAMLWLLLAIAAVLVAALLWRVLGDVRRARTPPTDAPAHWTPAEADAQALLEDADRLAAQGRFDEATRLLLKRSVGQIAAARPGLLDPSSTAREIAALAALSAQARSAFGIIAARVERSLFALHSLSAEDWQAARAAYADFALAAPRAA